MTSPVFLETTVPVRGLTRAMYERLVKAGDLEGQPVELLGGVLIEMSPQGPEHSWVIEEIARILRAGLDPDEIRVREEKPLALDASSEPEPDLAITDVPGPHAHPTMAHLVIEVARSSQRVDLSLKADRYAAAGIPVYWVWDLPAREVVAHTDPTPDGYATVERHGPDATLHALGVDVRLADLLPVVDQD